MNKVLIKDIPNNDRPRERFLSLGAKNVSNEDLISIILKTGTKNRSVKDLSITLLSKFKDISNFKDLEVNSITNIDGIGNVKAIELIAAIELGRRVYQDKKKDKYKIRKSEDIYNYIKDEVRARIFKNMLLNIE